MNTTIDEPLVSVIVPAHFSSETIAETLDSIIAQEYDNYEIIVVSDHVDISTQKILEKYKNNCNKLKIVNLGSKCGVGYARYIGIKKSKGEYIAFLDSDDLWKKDKLYRQVKFMRDNNVSFSYSDYELINEDGSETGKIRVAPRKVSYMRMLRGDSIGCLTVMVESRFLKRIPVVLLQKRNDYALWCSALKEIRLAKKVPGILASYRKSNHGLSSGSKFSLIKYHYKLHRRHNGFSPAVSFLLVVSNVFVYLGNITIRTRKSA